MPSDPNIQSLIDAAVAAEREAADRIAEGIRGRGVSVERVTGA